MSAWDDLITAVETWAETQTPANAESILLPIVEQAMADRSVDRELHAPDVARWLVGLTLGHQALRARVQQVDEDLDLADLRLITTRWLHPARPGV